MPLVPLFLLVPLFYRFSLFPCSFCSHFLLCCPVFLVPPLPLFTLFPCSPCSPGLLLSLFPLLPLFVLLACSPCAPLFFLLPCSSSSPVSLSRLNPLFHFFPCSPCSPHPFSPCFPFSFCFPLSLIPLVPLFAMLLRSLVPLFPVPLFLCPSPRDTQFLSISVKLDIGHPCYGQLTAFKKGLSAGLHKTVSRLDVQPIELTFFSYWFLIDRRLRSISLRRNSC